MTFEQYKKKYPEDIPLGFVEKDYSAMIGDNPYRHSVFFSDHQRWNRIYILAWIRGKYQGFSEILDWIKGNKSAGWTMNKEDFRKMFAEITHDPEFGMKKKEEE